MLCYFRKRSTIIEYFFFDISSDEIILSLFLIQLIVLVTLKM